MDFLPVQSFNISKIQEGPIETGKTQIVVSSEDIEIGVARCLRRKHGPFHSHDGAEVIFVLEGTLTVDLIDRRKQFVAGEVVIIPPSLIHATSSLDGAVKLMIRKK